jgi:hypothetical protein
LQAKIPRCCVYEPWILTQDVTLFLNVDDILGGFEDFTSGILGYNQIVSSQWAGSSYLITVNSGIVAQNNIIFDYVSTAVILIEKDPVTRSNNRVVFDIASIRINPLRAVGLHNHVVVEIPPAGADYPHRIKIMKVTISDDILSAKRGNSSSADLVYLDPVP